MMPNDWDWWFIHLGPWGIVLLLLVIVLLRLGEHRKLILDIKLQLNGNGSPPQEAKPKVDSARLG